MVYLNFQGGEGDRLESLSLSNGPRVKLGYLLFPGFIANRIQGLWANQNAIQRLAFFQDGLRIYAQSPIIGSGLGSFEGQLFSVQDFYYETTYVHNHYIQVLLEMGFPGCSPSSFSWAVPLSPCSAGGGRGRRTTCCPPCWAAWRCPPSTP